MVEISHAFFRQRPDSAGTTVPIPTSRTRFGCDRAHTRPAASGLCPGQRLAVPCDETRCARTGQSARRLRTPRVITMKPSRCPTTASTRTAPARHVAIKGGPIRQVTLSASARSTCHTPDFSSSGASSPPGYGVSHNIPQVKAMISYVYRWLMILYRHVQQRSTAPSATNAPTKPVERVASLPRRNLHSAVPATDPCSVPTPI
jgi:hypothetical protein